ncbi:DEKNAAC101068 [Brettanomyces naardenensis]|uniref:Decapping nuclease n=1 Tax=Brettanomyces naardenensis TaxID=13370 RepID=A0A448YGU1_BRENA|nr:DEKNAAC101068 [Brettanomyces naardenensis]
MPTVTKSTSMRFSSSNKPHYSVQNNLVKREVGYYSQINANQIAFNKSELEPFHTPDNRTLRGRKWDVRKGYQSFHRKKYALDESRARNLLLTAIKYEVDHGKGSVRPRILCHSGFFGDVINNSKESYDIIDYQGQIIISSRDRRLNEDLLFAFIGIRFEDLLKTNEPSIATDSNYRHFKTLCEGTIGDSGKGFKYLSVTEIDSLLDSSKDPVNYTEIKLTVLKRFQWERLDHVNSTTFLKMALKARPWFNKQLLKWIVQCKYGMSSHLLLGLRDGDFHVRAIRSFDVEKELIPFLRDYCKREYRQYEESVDKVIDVVGWIEEQIKESDGDKVYRLDIHEGDFVFSRLDEEERRRVFDNVIIEEFKKWREGKENPLTGSEYIKEDAEEEEDRKGDVEELRRKLERVYLR